MRKLFTMILAMALLLSLTACGGETAPAAEAADLQAVYESMQDTLPEMIVMDEDTMLNFFGIEAEDCLQVVTAICADGLRTDEVWLIEAKDEATLEEILALAETRLVAKADETINYTPDQYLVVEKAELLTEGNYLALLVSPDVDTLKAAFEDAVK